MASSSSSGARVPAPLDISQERHVDLLVQLLRKHGAAFDLSPTGSGKTYHAIIAHRLLCPHHHLTVVCPASLRPKWEGALRSAGTTSFTVLSYNELGGSSKRKREPPSEAHGNETLRIEVAQGLLVRSDTYEWAQTAGSDKVRQVAHRTSYELSARCAQLLHRTGLMLVLDEVQHIKKERTSRLQIDKEPQRRRVG